MDGLFAVIAIKVLAGAWLPCNLPLLFYEVVLHVFIPPLHSQGSCSEKYCYNQDGKSYQGLPLFPWNKTMLSQIWGMPIG